MGSSSAALPDDTRVYAVGDVHGCRDLLRELHELILADAAAAPEGRKRVVYLGDYVDRGPDSAGVVELLLAARDGGLGEDIETIHLKGNHEDFLLRFLADAETGGYWILNGGGATMKSYGVDRVPNLLGTAFADLGPLSAAFGEALPSSDRAFFEGLRLNHIEGDYLFVHAGIMPGRDLHRQSEADMLWIREPFLSSDADHGRMVVHGHSPVAAPQLLDNRINIDTGAVWSGRLTALVLYGAERELLQT